MTTTHRGINSTKGRRNPGACDICRRRKIKCDSGERGVDKIPRVCEKLRYKPRDPSREDGEGFEQGVDLSTELDRLADMPESHGSPLSDLGASPETSEVLPQSEEEEEEDVESAITRKLQKMDMGNRFYGKSSSARLMATAFNLKDQYVGKSRDAFKPRKREEFWVSHPWQRGKLDEELNLNVSTLKYPDDDLLFSLVDLYFQNFNFLLPLLHRPTFERQIAERLHTRDAMFGNVVLLVCALGAKHSNDPRVFTEGSNTTRSAGHKWYAQVDTCRKAYVTRPTLYELQMMILYLAFTKSLGMPAGTYVQVALGIKLAQDVGAHRRKLKKDGGITTEDELWKRAFWILFVYDKFMSALLGRPCTLHKEDYDQDYPIECDDEYWERPDPSKNFQQPPDKPSTISYFNCYILLMEIYGEALRLLYPTRRSTSRIEQVVTDLDSAMNKWLDCVPEHLRWDPNSKNMLFLQQSATLYITYYSVQMFIHRRFLASVHDLSSVPIPSQTICTNAARLSCCVVDVLNRLKIMPSVFVQSMSGTAALALVVNLWSDKHSGTVHNHRRELEFLQKVLDMLSVSEERWVAAGRLRDIIAELSDIEGGTGETVNPPKAEPDIDVSSLSPTPLGGYYNSMYPSESIIYHQQGIPSQPKQPNFTLPLYSHQLGLALPYEQVFTGKPLGDPLSKNDLTGNNGAFSSHVVVSEGSSRAADPGTGVHAYAPGVQNDGQMAEMWQTMDIDDMTNWLLSTNVYEWESYFMNNDQQKELTSGHNVYQ
ncbi:hypothetical protein APHAL10511_003810 [Amanita phalloides]|nr:hypothetical protein APHAL10511_003810 [Amanita phalloides]